MSNISQIPAAQAPDGETSNLINPTDISNIPRVTIYVLLPLMSVFLLLRVGSRIRIMHALGIDDVLCIVSAAAIYAWAGVVLPTLGNPEGRHIWDIPLIDIHESSLERVMISLVLNFTAAMFVRLSLLSLYLRVFNPIRWARILILVCMAIITVFYVVCIILILVKTVPRSGQTWYYTTFFYVKLEEDVSVAQGYFGVISDLAVLAIPLKLVYGLSLGTKRKIGVLAVFLTGLLAFGASIAGLVSRIHVNVTDATWTGCLSEIYVAFELNMSLICSCMPVVTVPLKIFVESVVQSWSSIRKYSRTIFSRSNETEKPIPIPKDQLPEIPSGTISGMKTFIRRLYRSNVQETVPMTDMSAFSKLGSVDEDYHQQLRAMHAIDIENHAARSNVPSIPGSRGQGI